MLTFTYLQIVLQIREPHAQVYIFANLQITEIPHAHIRYLQIVLQIIEIPHAQVGLAHTSAT